MIWICQSEIQLFNVLKQNYHEHTRQVYVFLADQISHTLLNKLPQKYINKQLCKHVLHAVGYMNVFPTFHEPCSLRLLLIA